MSKVANCYFIGHMHEFVYDDCMYLPTQDLFEVAEIFNNPYFLSLFCNPSALLTLAQGMDKQVYLKEDDRVKNAYIQRFNEELL